MPLRVAEEEDEKIGSPVPVHASPSRPGPSGAPTGFTGEPSGAAVLVATAAGEVGVDLDADHLVCDLGARERMVQRLGRVNRRGGDSRVAQITVIPEKTLDERIAAPLMRLPAIGEARDTSLAALEALAADPAGQAVLAAASLKPARDHAGVTHINGFPPASFQNRSRLTCGGKGSP